jgi:DNA-binding transcriptional LysR family regulator
VVNWDDLKVFLAVHRTGSFAAAGRTLSVNATTIGRRITTFESHLGSRLFTRTSDGLVPTATAESLLDAAEQMERHVKMAERRVAGEDARLEGTVRLAVTVHFASAFLVDQLRVFRRRHPMIELELLTSTALHDLSRGAADLAVRFTAPGGGVPMGPQGPTDVLAQRTCNFGVGVFASRAYLDRTGPPEDLHALEGLDLVVPAERMRYIPGYDWSSRARENNRVAVTLDGIQAMVAATAAGFGLCALPCFLTGRYPELVRIGTPETVDVRESWLMMPADMKRVARVRALRDYLLEIFDTWEPVLAGRVSPHEPYSPPRPR